MKRVTRKRWIAAAAASGAMAAALPGAAAYADGAADGTATDSPGLLSGNGVRLPVHLPVSACGNTVNVVGLLNPAMGNDCANTGAAPAHSTSAHARVEHAPGVVSGNGVQLPVDLPVNLSGNTVNVVGVGNPVLGNTSANTGGEPPSRPAHPAVPHPSQPAKPPARPRPQPSAPLRHASPAPGPRVTLAHTGADGTLPALATGAALLLGGTVLYRRYRPGRTT
ncbi:LPXTG-motif cell wall anchor domain protein [Actinobacteria bacterium OK074]|nr:LPXTG-motif cell wall anchor domain protein [Actinobacteria bacterium OK074]